MIFLYISLFLEILFSPSTSSATTSIVTISDYLQYLQCFWLVPSAVCTAKKKFLVR